MSTMTYYVELYLSAKLRFTLDACRRTSTTTLTGSPGVISFIASIHHLYA